MFLFIKKCGLAWTYRKQNLNTSHVLIYRKCIYRRGIVRGFKYISCSYLSHPEWHLQMSIYQFKYISCSYLSMVFLLPVVTDYLFKYISCSYLSNVFTHFLFSIISYIALFFNISQLFYQPPPLFSFSSSLVSFPLIL